MKKTEKEKLARQIREKIEMVRQDIVSYTERTQPVAPDDAIGRLTRMDAIGNKSINEAALREARNTLAKLERALKMIDRPGFGLCRECEEKIPLARLMIMPESDMCVTCTEEME
ncbi:TraR/DksA family transcriptional regulator [Thermodesulfobacteriota bacterium]